MQKEIFRSVLLRMKLMFWHILKLISLLPYEKIPCRAICEYNKIIYSENIIKTRKREYITEKWYLRYFHKKLDLFQLHTVAAPFSAFIIGIWTFYLILYVSYSLKSPALIAKVFFTSICIKIRNFIRINIVYLENLSN